MTTANDEKTLIVCRVDLWPNGKWRLIAHGDGDEGATVTSLLDSHPGVEPGDRIRIHSEPLRVEKLSEVQRHRDGGAADWPGTG